MAQVGAGDQTENIQLHTLNPADLETEHPPDARLHAGATIGPAKVGKRSEIAPDRLAIASSAMRRVSSVMLALNISPRSLIHLSKSP